MEDPTRIIIGIFVLLLSIIASALLLSHHKTSLMAKSPDPLAFACAEDSRHVACVIIAGRK